MSRPEEHGSPDCSGLPRPIENKRAHLTEPNIRSIIGSAAVDRIIAKANGHCTWCGMAFGDTWHTRPSIDHIRPRTLGGTDDESNVIACCRSCNTSKRNRTIGAFHKYRCLRKIGAPAWITVPLMDWLIENGWTTYRYDPYPWAHIAPEE